MINQIYLVPNSKSNAQSIIFLILVLGVFLLLLLLPSLLELRKPKDAGPRNITEPISEEQIR